MTPEEFKQLKIGDLVVCYEIDETMPFGWDDKMDELIGLPLTVTDKIDNGVKIEYNDLYYFTYHVNNIEMYKKDHDFFILNNYKYIYLKPIIPEYLGAFTLNEDFKIYCNLYNKFKKNNSYVYFSKKLYFEIKQECPRVIGVLISRNFIKKEKVNEFND
jgi:hypothetical protein